MKKILVITFSFIALSFTIWQPNFEAAKKMARDKHKLILLNFSGSDWCGPCIRMRKEIFEDDRFSKMADTTLILVNADFPRNKKNQLDKLVEKQNEALADRYNPSGKFPFTLLLDASGKIINSWDGLPKENAAQFAKEIREICDANK
jgi:thioredoxin-related protein